MRATRHQPRRPPRRRPAVLAALATLALALARLAPAADLPPAVVATFTQRVQPLLLNRCAAGACHGGPESPAPRLHRGPGGAAPARPHTRANLQALLDAVGPGRDPQPLITLFATGHPATAGTPARHRASPLTGPERMTLERWLADVRAAERQEDLADADGATGVVRASAEIESPAPPQPNRFRTLLDSAANPPALPPPEEPKGVIFKNDVPPEP